MFNFGPTKALREERDSLRRQLYIQKLQYETLIEKWNTLVKQINKNGGQQFLDHARVDAQQQFTNDDLRRLLQLCHPDKHGGSNLAVEMTAKLNKARS